MQSLPRLYHFRFDHRFHSTMVFQCICIWYLIHFATFTFYLFSFWCLCCFSFYFIFCFFLFGNFAGLSLKSSSWTKLCVSHPFVLDFGFSMPLLVLMVLLLKLFFIFRYSKIYEYKFRQAIPIGKYCTHRTSMLSNDAMCTFGLLYNIEIHGEIKSSVCFTILLNNKRGVCQWAESAYQLILILKSTNLPRDTTPIMKIARNWKRKREIHSIRWKTCTPCTSCLPPSPHVRKTIFPLNLNILYIYSISSAIDLYTVHCIRRSHRIVSICMFLKRVH